MTDQMDEATRNAVRKIEGLMRLAGNNPNEQEAASALAKAQELLAAYNLDMAVIEQSSSNTTSGMRLDEMVSGGMHKYQRQLWNHIAELNFCMYWTQKNRVKPGSIQERRKRRFTHEHRLVGRQVNVISTKHMAIYIEKTIERLCREMLGSERSMQYYSSYAVAFREGVADRVIEKIADRRRDLIKKEKREQAETARKASAKGQSASILLTVAGLSEKEEAANYDFLHGEGAWARKLAQEAKWEAEWAQQRVTRAKALAEAEKAHAAWAAAHPEEAAAEAKKERARERAKERARDRRAFSGSSRYRFRETKEDMRRSSGAYHRGYAKGESVSIDPQVGDGADRRIARA